MNKALAIIAILSACLWPAVLNRQPLFFADTTGYVRGAAAGFARFLHQKTVWSDTNGSSSGDAKQQSPAGTAPTSKTVLAGRSIYYGALLFLSQLGGGDFWPAIVLQAAAVVFAVALTLQTFGIYTLRSLAVISICLAALTPMAFFASYLMPDIFASMAILAWANMAIAGNRMPRWAFVSWLCLLTAALLFHPSHSLITIPLVIGTVIYCWSTHQSVSWKSVAAFSAAFAVALTGEVMFNAVTKKAVGTSPLRPPFLTARLVADGPGYRYLLKSCPASGFELCKYTARIAALQHAKVTRPLSDEFLWNVDPAVGVFSAIDSSSQRKIADEQFRFVARTVAFDPASVVRFALKNSEEQLRMFSFDEFGLDEGGRGYFLVRMPQPYLSTLERSRLWLDQLPTKDMSALALFAVIASLILGVACLLVWKPLSLPVNGVPLFCFIISAGVLVNAIICGSLSTPHDRYEARVIWLLPFLAMLLLRIAAQTFRLRAGFAVVPNEISKPQRDPLAI